MRVLRAAKSGVVRQAPLVTANTGRVLRGLLQGQQAALAIRSAECAYRPRRPALELRGLWFWCQVYDGAKVVNRLSPSSKYNLLPD